MGLCGGRKKGEGRKELIPNSMTKKERKSLERGVRIDLSEEIALRNPNLITQEYCGSSTELFIDEWRIGSLIDLDSK